MANLGVDHGSTHVRVETRDYPVLSMSNVTRLCHDLIILACIARHVAVYLHTHTCT